MEQKREFEAWREVVRAIVPGGDVNVYRTFGEYDYLDLSLVRVPLADRENGLANRVMQAIHDYADERGLPVYLTAEKLGKIGPSSTRLAKWYRGLGYVPNRGRNKDFRGPLGVLVMVMNFARPNKDAWSGIERSEELALQVLDSWPHAEALAKELRDALFDAVESAVREGMNESLERAAKHIETDCVTKPKDWGALPRAREVAAKVRALKDVRS